MTFLRVLAFLFLVLGMSSCFEEPCPSEEETPHIVKQIPDSFRVDFGTELEFSDGIDTVKLKFELIEKSRCCTTVHGGYNCADHYESCEIDEYKLFNDTIDIRIRRSGPCLEQKFDMQFEVNNKSTFTIFYKYNPNFVDSIMIHGDVFNNCFNEFRYEQEKILAPELVNIFTYSYEFGILRFTIFSYKKNESKIYKRLF